VIAPLQFSNLAAIHTRCDEIRGIVGLARHLSMRASHTRHGWTVGWCYARRHTHAPARVPPERNDVIHRARELLSVARRR
jgi:hypothetical protein